MSTADPPATSGVDLRLRPPRRSEEELRHIVDQGKQIFGEEAEPLELLLWFGKRLGVERLAVAVSFSDGVMAYLAAHAVPGVDLLFVDTGYHFAETLGLRDAVASTQKVNVRSLQPELATKQQDERYGAELWRTDPDKCCAMRKTAPMDNALRGYEAWATGLRRNDHDGRVRTPLIEWDERHRMIKLNPIAAYSDEQIDACIVEYGIMENPLRQLGYRSIGCEPCTQPVADGAPERSGRWAGRNKVECGMHI
ncbi:MAG: phosphoadenylyl-sulfate reductase [Actinomycetia bacterium]|nr:phosphoadenylyl-sulfate reductase [Actinomycetes bacterium]MCH9801481.1 phosphoadenylyl-sulfate reductase [Actinomycetes bacterium]